MTARWLRRVAGLSSLASLASLAASHSSPVQWLTAVQQDTRSTAFSAPSARISSDGRHVVFGSYAALLQTDRSRGRDVYTLDLTTGRVTRESVAVGAHPPDGDSFAPDVSRDGRIVVFASGASNLVTPGPTNHLVHVYVRDRPDGRTTLVSTTCAGVPADHGSLEPVVSADGSTVAFTSSATDLCPTTTPANGSDVYAVRVATGQRLRVSVSSGGEVRLGQSGAPAIDGDGRRIAFMSRADLTTPPDAADRNRVADVYLRDTLAGTTTRISRSATRGDANGPSYHPAISADGRLVAFASEATNLVHGLKVHGPQVYVYDTRTGSTELVSRGASGQAADDASIRPQLSATGMVVAFQSLASNLRCASRCTPLQRDINLAWDVYLRDRSTGRTVQLTADHVGPWIEGGRTPVIDHGARVAVLISRHPRDDYDLGEDEDVFVKQLRP